MCITTFVLEGLSCLPLKEYLSNFVSTLYPTTTFQQNEDRIVETRIIRRKITGTLHIFENIRKKEIPSSRYEVRHGEKSMEANSGSG